MKPRPERPSCCSDRCIQASDEHIMICQGRRVKDLTHPDHIPALGCYPYFCSLGRLKTPSSTENQSVVRGRIFHSGATRFRSTRGHDSSDHR